MYNVHRRMYIYMYLQVTRYC